VASEQASEAPVPGGFLFNVNLVFVTTLASNILNFFIAILLARALGPEGRGITALYQGGVNFAFTILSLGIAAAAVYFVARRELTPRQLMEAGLSVTVFATAITLAGVLLLRAFWGDDLAAKEIPYGLAVVAVPAATQFRMTETLLRAQGRFGAMNIIEFSLPLSICLSLAAVEVTSGLTIPRAVWAWTLGFLPPLLLGYVLLGPSAWPHRFASVALLVKTVPFGSQAQLGNLLQLFNYRLDSYIILVFVNAAGVGLYAVGVAGSEGLWLIANSVAIVLLTNLTAGDADNAARLTPVVCRNTILVTGVICLGAAFIAPFVIPAVFGSDFQDSVPVYLWLLPGTVALSGTKILAVYVFSRGRPMINTAIAAAGLVTSIISDLILIPILEVEGAAIAASLGYGLSLVLTAIAYRRLSGNSILDALLPHPSDLALYLEGLRSLRRRLPGHRAASLHSNP
jgi:O-antigen/teichoic acid export membrane protein